MPKFGRHCQVHFGPNYYLLLLCSKSLFTYELRDLPPLPTTK